MKRFDQFEQGNKKIAQFQKTHKQVENCEYQFNRSWGQLYPVITLIQDLGYTVHMGPVSCQILDGDRIISEQDLQDTRLKGTWLAVTQFIDYHNSI